MKDITITGGINIEIARKENFQGALSICYKAKTFLRQTALAISKFLPLTKANFPGRLIIQMDK